MEKKYLMLLPLAIPLFFGGKAAVTAIKRKSHTKVNGHDDLENIKTVTLSDQSTSDEIAVSDSHIEELRGSLIQENRSSGVSADPGEIEEPSEEEIQFPDEEEITPPQEEEINSKAPVNPDDELPGEDEPGRMTLRGDSENQKENLLQGKEIFTGPKGGKYYFNDAGKKIYIK